MPRSEYITAQTPSGISVEIEIRRNDLRYTVPSQGLSGTGSNLFPLPQEKMGATHYLSLPGNAWIGLGGEEAYRVLAAINAYRGRFAKKGLRAELREQRRILGGLMERANDLIVDGDPRGRALLARFEAELAELDAKLAD